MSIQEEIDVSELADMRERMNLYLRVTDKKEKITVTTIIVKSVSAALKKYPIMNSKFDIQNQDKVCVSYI